MVINGNEIDADFGWMLTYPFNMLSTLPVLNVPSGHATNGIPMGVQIVGRPYQDFSVFQVGKALEELTGSVFQ